MKLAKIIIINLVLTLSLGVGVYSMPIVTYGTDGNGSTINSENAYLTWKSQLTSYITDQLDGLTEIPHPGPDDEYVSPTGNSFHDITSSVDDDMWVSTLGNGVMEGTSLGFERNDDGIFVWTLDKPSNAFGFFANDNDGGEVIVTFTDGGSHRYEMTSFAANNDSLFWGISGLSTLISTVTIQTYDPGGKSYWDRFSYGVTATAPVPEPATFILLGIGLVGLAGAEVRRRRKKKAVD